MRLGEAPGLGDVVDGSGGLDSDATSVEAFRWVEWVHATTSSSIIKLVISSILIQLGSRL